MSIHASSQFQVGALGATRQDYVTIALGLVGATAVAISLRVEPLQAAIVVALVVVGTWLSVIDFKEHRLPNNIVVPTGVGVAAAVLGLGLVESDFDRSVSAIGTAAIVFGVLFVLAMLNGIGMGDVKYSFALTALLAWFGSDALVVGAMAMCFSSGAYAVAVMIRRRTLNEFIPFGPFMTVGLVVGILAVAPW